MFVLLIYWIRCFLLRQHRAWLAISIASCCHAQTLVVEVPEKPPRDFLFQASEGNLFFEKYQAQELSAELEKFATETGFVVYVVTVNSPSKPVLDNLRQQIKTKWTDKLDGMVIFYDLDTRMLAVEFEQLYHLKDETIMPSKLLGVPEKVWINFIDDWLHKNQQAEGLEVRQALPFFRDFLVFMRQELTAASRKSSLPVGVYWGLLGLILTAFYIYWWFQKFTRRSLSNIHYEFPALRMNHRLKARFGGGLLSVRHFGAPRNSR